MADGELIVGLTDDNHLVSFRAHKPNQSLSDVAISGLVGGERVIGVDFRPSDLNADGIDDVGQLYAATDAGRIYRLDASTGVASMAVMLNVALQGSPTGVGFNPVPDRLRIHTNTGQNLRINVDNGATLVDGALMYLAGDVNAGVAPMIAATGYTNNDNDVSTGTVLYALDARTNALVTFPPPGGPNSGLMSTVGPLGVEVTMASGFDISLPTGTAYAVLATSASGKSTLYTIDLATGAATKLGLLAQTRAPLLSIAVLP